MLYRILFEQIKIVDLRLLRFFNKKGSKLIKINHNSDKINLVFAKNMLKIVYRFSVLLTLISFILPLFSPAPKFIAGGLKRIVIDAGHGGHDPGCIGSRSKEKNVALSVSKMLGDYIKDNVEGVEVIYTRDKDHFVELHQRANIANKYNADLFVCIHCNSGPSHAYGSETYVMGLHKSKENLSVANRENQSILMEDDYEANYDGFDPNSDEANILFAMFQSAHLDNSLNFAAKVQDQFRDRVGRRDRGVKQAGFLVLYKTAMPSVLIETGFLTNKEEESFLATENGQALIASAIYRAFKEYKTDVDKPYIQKLEKENNKYVNSDDRKVENTIKVPKDSISIGSKLETTDGIIFKVQFTASNSKLELKPENFNGLTGVTEYQAENVYRYAIGAERNFSEANKIKNQLKEMGYKDSFVIAFKDGSRISVEEARKLAKE
jgi:N-acetylmuramoyl-L-alanine amidase